MYSESLNSLNSKFKSAKMSYLRAVLNSDKKSEIAHLKNIKLRTI